MENGETLFRVSKLVSASINSSAAISNTERTLENNDSIDRLSPVESGHSTNNTVQGNIPKIIHESVNQLLLVSVSYYSTTSELQGIIPVEVTMADGQLATVELGGNATISNTRLDITVENNN